MPCDPTLRELTEAAGRLFAEAGAVVEGLAPWLSEATLVALDRFWRLRLWVGPEAVSPQRPAPGRPPPPPWARAAPAGPCAGAQAP